MKNLKGGSGDCQVCDMGCKFELRSKSEFNTKNQAINRVTSNRLTELSLWTHSCHVFSVPRMMCNDFFAEKFAVDMGIQFGCGYLFMSEH